MDAVLVRAFKTEHRSNSTRHALRSLPHMQHVCVMPWAERRLALQVRALSKSGAMQHIATATMDRTEAQQVHAAIGQWLEEDAAKQSPQKAAADA